ALPIKIHRSAEEAMFTPTALHWRHPVGDLPRAAVLWLTQQGPDGRWSKPSKHTYTMVDHGQLPVLSLTAHPGAWSDPDSGLLVVGHGIFHADEKVLDYYANDPRWWKYPGNFHGRGKQWERSAHVELFDAQGRLILHTPAAVRMNGQMTRGFPQHAFRLTFDAPLEVPLFADGDGAGTEALVLRAAGNDQVKAMMRDAYQHGACAGLPFATARSLSCVVYLNGAYWGVHHLRQRMDEKEIARRYGVKKSKIELLEDRARPVNADSSAVRDFLELVRWASKRDTAEQGWSAHIEERLDVDAFLTYMASQMILGNMDWPRQNLKYWRYTGKPRAGTDLDGRWRFIMGDSDLSFGANAPVDVGLFKQVELANAPVSTLFMGMFRSPAFKARFHARATELLDGPLSSARLSAQLDGLVQLLQPEMDRHTRRWRKPASLAAWTAEVEVMRNYALHREKACRAQLEALQQGSTPR
ncbi:MAG: CotH kinase family protein, partial [Flavobacteriales bacterium]|nr:CotH kinase family protein [Flavobacteriales bacterium]